MPSRRRRRRDGRDRSRCRGGGPRAHECESARRVERHGEDRAHRRWRREREGRRRVLAILRSCEDARFLARTASASRPRARPGPARRPRSTTSLPGASAREASVGHSRGGGCAGALAGARERGRGRRRRREGGRRRGHRCQALLQPPPTRSATAPRWQWRSFEALGDRGVVDPVVSYDRGLAYAAASAPERSSRATSGARPTASRRRASSRTTPRS